MLRILPLLAAALYLLGTALPARATFLDCLFTTGFEDNGTTASQPAAAVQLHNCARRTVVPAASTPIAPLTWSDDIAILAQTWASGCVWGHSHLPGYGENTYAAAGFTPTMKTAVAAWLSEQPYYNYANNTCSAPADPGTCGHYTQAVWDTTTQVGCGLSYCTQNSPWAQFPNWYFIVCDYLPAGNDGGRPY